MEDPIANAEAAPQLRVHGDAPTAAVAEPARKPNVPHMINPNLAGVWDAKGRFIEVRKLGAMDRLDLAVILGPENSKNPMVQGYTALAFSVAKIDGEAIFPPASYNELRALVGRLADEGLNAVAETADLLNPEMEKLTPEAEAEAVKNS